MPPLRQLFSLLPFIALLLALSPTPSHAKLRFGEVERLRHVADTTLTDPSGARLHLARKVVERHFLLPYALEDQGYVLGVSGDSRAYYPLPTGEKLATLQQAGHLPTPLPPYRLDTLDWVVGHLLWLTLLGLALYGGGHWAWSRRRAARAGPAAEPSWAAPATAVQHAAPPPLTVTLPLRLHASRLKLMGLLALCIGFVVIGVLIHQEHRVLGLVCAGFFGLGIPIFLVQMLPGASFLELHADRFVYRALFRERTIHWRDVASLAVVKLQGRTMVGYDFTPSHASRVGGHKVSKAMAGTHAALPETFGMKPIALAELMDQIRRHHLQSQHPSTPA